MRSLKSRSATSPFRVSMREAPTSESPNARHAAPRLEPAAWVRNLLVSLLVAVGLLALLLAVLPQPLLDNPWVRIPLIAATPCVALLVHRAIQLRTGRR